MAASRMLDVVVVGAGLCGLTAAYHLTRAGYSVVLVEASDRVGGVIQTLDEAGFRMEAGPTTFQSSGEEIRTLALSLGLTPVAATPLAKKRYLYLKGRLLPLPENPWAFLKSPVLSGQAKLRLLQEPWIPRGSDPEETLAAFVRRRLGSEVLEHLVGPFVSGVYAGDPEQLSMAAAFPRLAQWEAEAGSLLKGAISAKRQARQTGKKPAPYQLLSFPEGMAALPKALAKALPAGCLRLSSPVQTLEPLSSGGYRVLCGDGEVLEARCVVLATPAGVTAAAIAPFLPEASRVLRDIPYAPLAVVHVGAEEKALHHALEGFGFLVPRTEGLPLLGSIWASSLFPSRAPAGTVLLSNFIGGALQPGIKDWPDDRIVQQVLADLRQIFHLPSLSPIFTQVFRYPQAIPQYTVGHLARAEALERHLSQAPGLFLTGNYLQGASVNDCVKQAQQTVSHLTASLQAIRG